MNWDRVIAELETRNLSEGFNSRWLAHCLRKGLEPDRPKKDETGVVYVRSNEYWFPIGQMQYMDVIEGKERLVFTAKQSWENREGVLIYKLRIGGLELQFAGVATLFLGPFPPNTYKVQIERFETISKVL